jgi:phage shock protein E
MRNSVVFLALAAAAMGLSGCVTVPPATSYTDPAALAALIRDRTEPYILVDVRGFSEYMGGHIPTAVNIPVDVIAEKPPTRDKAALLIVYCASGGRSARAAKALLDLGYARVADFGAVSRWTGDLVRGDKP